MESLLLTFAPVETKVTVKSLYPIWGAEEKDCTRREKWTVKVILSCPARDSIPCISDSVSNIQLGDYKD